MQQPTNIQPTAPNAQYTVDQLQAHAPQQATDQSGEVRSDTVELLEIVDAMSQGIGNLSRMDQERIELEQRNKACCVMIVDDEEANVLTVRQHLIRAGYENFLITTDARNVISQAANEQPDLILLDIKMPHINGLEVLKMLGADVRLRDIPVVILTAAADPKIRNAALDLGAHDFLTKPVDPSELVPRVRNALMIKAHFDQLDAQNAQLEETVRQRTQELYESRQQIILGLARAAEHRDNDTGNHVLRVGCYAAIVAKHLGWRPDAVEMIQQAAQLHDVGKIGIPDSILFKPGKLDETEFNVMKNHCALGKTIIEPLNRQDSSVLRTHASLGESILHVRNSPLMMMAARIAQTHHEHWNGNGYPLGLAGADIPIEGRITAVADVYDALSSKRPYKEAFPREKCFAIMKDLRGTQFDPDILDAFFACSNEIIEVQLAFMDE